MSSHSFSSRMKKNHLDQFYTIEKCVENAVDQIDGILQHVTTTIDSSAGTNYFCKYLKSKYPNIKTISYDIDPPINCEGQVHKQDFLKLSKSQTNGVTLLGFNPPFGYRGVQAKKFIEHGIKVFYPDIIFMIVPNMISQSRYSGYDLILHEKLRANSFVIPDGTTFSFKCTLVCHSRISFDAFTSIPPNVQTK